MTLSAHLRTLKSHYRSGGDDLGAQFFSPCLGEASLYRRAAGYFSSLALLTWANALPRLVGGQVRVSLIASPELSAPDIATFKELDSETRRSDYRRVIVERMLDEIIALAKNPSDHGARARVLAWLIANERLEIRFAFAEHVDRPGIFHEKIGIFDFPAGERVAFTGSANETLGGHHLNYESLDVYRSWIAGDEDRVRTKVEQFEEAWTGDAAGLEVEVPSAEVIARLRARAPERLPKVVDPAKSESTDPRWRHQTEAVDVFLQKRSGVLEMATGTGKTRTTLKILGRLIEGGDVDAAVLAMDGTDLMDQWCGELDEWLLGSGCDWLLYRQFERHKEAGDFALDANEGILVISRGQVKGVLNRLRPAQKKRMIIVHDEVHGLGVPTLVKELRNEHPKFGWRLGLSATPERAYDQAGNDFIAHEIGPTVYCFPLEAAIHRGVLSEFDYVPLEYELTEGDRKRIRDVYAMQAARRREGNPITQEEVWIELAKVYKTAEMKPVVFASHLSARPDTLNNCIIFVETKEYGNSLLEEIHSYTTRYRTYYAEDDRDHLIQFARGEIDCLVTCHRISQGIDIHALNTVVLFSSSRSKLETIQRIGRCLRADPRNPRKRARVLDFVRPQNPADKLPNADTERSTWLAALANTRTEHVG